MVVILGLTGGIASGKSSTASQIVTSLRKLEKEGLEVVSIDGDKLGQRMIRENPRITSL